MTKQKSAKKARNPQESVLAGMTEAEILRLPETQGILAEAFRDANNYFGAIRNLRNLLELSSRDDKLLSYRLKKARVAVLYSTAKKIEDKYGPCGGRLDTLDILQRMYPELKSLIPV
jgi:hypothetical protein